MIAAEERSRSTLAQYRCCWCVERVGGAAVAGAGGGGVDDDGMYRMVAGSRDIGARLFCKDYWTQRASDIPLCNLAPAISALYTLLVSIFPPTTKAPPE